MTDPISTSPPPRRSLRKALVLPAVFFVGGIGATGWFLTRTETGSNLIASAPAPIAVDPARIAAPSIAASPDLATRIAELEMRLTRAEAGAATATGASTASDRATGLVLAFAARRALERGQPLGPIEEELRAHFGSAQPHLIAAISSAAKDPVTLEQLRTGFDTLAPALSGNNEGWWAKLTNSLSSLVAVRDATQSPSDPASLLMRAKAALDQGRVSEALGEVAKLPARAEAGDWMAMARRYAEADKALDALEKTALEGVPAPAPALPPATTVLPDAPNPSSATQTF